MDAGGQDAGGGEADAPVGALRDNADREELRQRYYGLMQELRVVLPGVQVLMAFLLTAPFAARFSELDGTERAAFQVALVASMLATICLVSPTAFHRAARTERAFRLEWAVRTTTAGLGLLAISLVAAILCVSRFAFGAVASWISTGAVALGLVALWLVVPLSHGDPQQEESVLARHGDAEPRRR